MYMCGGFGINGHRFLAKNVERRFDIGVRTLVFVFAYLEVSSFLLEYT